MCNKANERAKNTMIKLRQDFGNKCLACSTHFNHGKINLDFAHLTPCLKGRGRGRKERVYSINKNPQNFVLLCRPCHLTFDALLQERF